VTSLEWFSRPDRLEAIFASTVVFMDRSYCALLRPSSAVGPDSQRASSGSDFTPPRLRNPCEVGTQYRKYPMGTMWIRRKSLSCWEPTGPDCSQPAPRTSWAETQAAVAPAPVARTVTAPR